MIDSLVRLLPAAMRCPRNGFPERYALVTLHRPSNVDDSKTLRDILESLLEINEGLSVVFPVHPRTRQRIEEFGLNAEKLHLSGPLPYVEFLAMQQRAAGVADSGGIQEETTYLGVPCFNVTRQYRTAGDCDFGDERDCRPGKRRSLVQNCRRLLRAKQRRELYPRSGTGTQQSVWLKFCRR